MYIHLGSRQIISNSSKVDKFLAVDHPGLKIPVGSKIKFFREKQKYTVRASNACFLICTKPFNARKTTLYTIVDRKEGIRGAENLVFGMGAETDQECREMLQRLTEGETEVSHRNRVDLDIEKYYILKEDVSENCEDCECKMSGEDYQYFPKCSICGCEPCFE